ncbi:MAG: hypothetical protein ACRDGN_06225 [bacterium]
MYILIAIVVATGIYVWDLYSRPGPVSDDPRDPAVRAKAAAQTVTGEPTVRRVVIDEAGTVAVEARSKYYNPDASLAENRQYLATEGRLIVQLILNDVPEMVVARVALFSGRTTLAVVEGRANQEYADYKVTYQGPLAR